MRETAVFYRSWFEAAAGLPAADFKSLFMSLADLAFNGAGEEGEALLGACLSPVASAIATLARPVIKRNAEKWEASKRSAGRPPIDLSPEDADKAVSAAGTVRGAARLLGVSVRTVQRRRGATKCQNAKTVNVNVNVNKDACHNSEKQDEASVASVARQKPAAGWLPLTSAEPTPPSEREKIASSLATFKEWLRQGKVSREERAEKTRQKSVNGAEAGLTAHNGYYAHFFYADDASKNVGA